ncbi:PilZ domain-containing protein [Desulfovibrio sp. OttesenSCG-928-O18]|nr:PilZ domain-containing protein [Desulfovibrio sp. OttesenSCG-928-O18]
MSASNANYAQIATYLRGRFRSLKGPEDHAYAPLSALPSGPSREEFMAASTLPDAVNRFLLQLDVKVDAILAGMQHSAMEHDFPHELEILTISASCLDFTTSLPLAPGDWLEVVVNFRQAGAFTASGIGKVTARRVEKDGTAVFSFSFTRILEEDRERIIKYVFKEERRQLRETRLD